jgi:hypothetical protein
MTNKYNLRDEEWNALKTEFSFSDEELTFYLDKINEPNADDNNSIPVMDKKDDVLRFLRDVFGIEKEHLKMNRTGNLNNQELGNLTFSVRKYNDVGNYLESENKNRVAEYARAKSSNTITTSTSKKGFFLNLTTTIRKINKNIGSKSVIRESSLFGGTKERIEGGDEE